MNFYIIHICLGQVIGNTHYATIKKVAGSRPVEMNEFFKIYLILPTALGTGVHSASNRNDYQKQANNNSGEYSVAGS
jgi:hypothetical protein